MLRDNGCRMCLCYDFLCLMFGNKRKKERMKWNEIVLLKIFLEGFGDF